MLNTLTTLITSWTSFMEAHRAVEPILMAVHLGSLAVGGGLALLADGLTLRAAFGSPELKARQMARLRTWHAPILVGLAVCCASGTLLAAADFEEFATSGVMGLKLGLLALLVLNGLLMLWAERGRVAAGVITTSVGSRRTGIATTITPRQPDWRVLSRAAMASAALWIAIAITGTQL
jgi:hypothetical protein